MPARTRNTRTDETATPVEGLPADATTEDVTGLTSETPEGEAQQTQPTTTPDSGLTADFLSQPVTLDMTAAPDFVKASAPQRARSERQQAMDKTVEALHDKWMTAGRPSVWGAIVAAKVQGVYFLPAEQVASFKKLVNRAKLLHDYRIKWGSDFVTTADMVTRFGLPAEYEGRSCVMFAAMDKRPRSVNGAVTTSQVPANGDDDDDDDEDDDED